MKSVDLVIIGAGPAGMSAAITVAGAGWSVVVLDEQATPGGQIYRSLETTPLKDKAILGDDYWDGQALIEAFRASGADFLGECSVWDISEDNIVSYTSKGQSHSIHCRHLILATGAMERSMPFPGWETPGVMTAGAGQILMKDAGMAAEDVVLLGSGPLLDVLALQYVKAGVPPKAIVDTTPFKNYWHACGHLSGAIRGWRYLLKGLKLKWDLKKAGVKRYAFASSVQARGDKSLSAISFVCGNKTVELKTSHLMTHFGVIPNINIIRALGIAIEWDDSQQCHRPVLDDALKTNRQNTYVVGDGLGIYGGKSAEATGKIAAYDLLKEDKYKVESQSFFQSDAVIRPFLEKLFRVSGMASPELSAETIVCKCESVSLADIDQAAALGARSLNEMKSYSRCGMGPCQGRQCGNAITMASAARHQRKESEIDYYKTRTPYIPITFKEMAQSDTH